MNGVIDTLNYKNSDDEIMNLYPRTLVEAITNKNGETLESLLQNAGTGNSAHPSQFSTMGMALETGWYRIGIIPSGAPFDCLFHVYDAGMDGNGMYQSHANVLIYTYTGDVNVKVLDCVIDGNKPDNVGFTHFDAMTYEGEIYLCGYYNNPDGIAQGTIITVTNLFTGQFSMEQDISVSFGLTPYEDIMTEPISTEAPEEFNVTLQNTSIATTADLVALKTELLGLVDELSTLVGGA